MPAFHEDQLERVRIAAFLVLQTSPGNHQAWVAVETGDREFSSRLKKGKYVDLAASGSPREGGHLQIQPQVRAEFPYGDD